MSGLTKILIVLQLVFSLVLSVLLVLMVSKQENYKGQLDAANAGSVGASATIAHQQVEIASLQASSSENLRMANDALATAQGTAARLAAEQTKLNNDIQQLQGERARLQQTVQSVTAANQTANQTIEAQRKELNDLQPKVVTLTAQAGQLGRANAEQETALRTSEQAIRKLQERIAELEQTATKPNASANSGNGNGTSGGMPIPNLVAGTPINGQITDLAQSGTRTYIETKLGTRDGVRENSRLAIYRGNTYVGDAVVQRATADASVAVVLTVKQGETVQKGDLVMTGE